MRHKSLSTGYPSDVRVRGKTADKKNSVRNLRNNYFFQARFILLYFLLFFCGRNAYSQFGPANPIGALHGIDWKVERKVVNKRIGNECLYYFYDWKAVPKENLLTKNIKQDSCFMNWADISQGAKIQIRIWSNRDIRIYTYDKNNSEKDKLHFTKSNGHQRLPFSEELILRRK